MKRFHAIYLVSLALLVLACNEDQEKVRIYSVSDFSKIKIVDTACINATERAKKDYESGKTVLTLKNLPEIKSFISSKAVISELAKFNLTLDTTPIQKSQYSRGYSQLFNEQCYEKSMTDYYHMKYPNLRLASVVSALEQKYISGHPSLVCRMNDLDDSRKHRKAKDFHEFYENVVYNFTYNFSYPDGYIRDNKKSSETTAEFILLKDGTPTGIKASSIFTNPANKAVAEKFTKKIIEVITKEKWTPAYCSGMPVNARITLNFRHR